MSTKRRFQFDHERLEVYQRALDLMVAADRFAHRFAGPRRHLGWQLHKAAGSVVLNIAEANGRAGAGDRAHFLQIALGSTLECAAVVDIGERLGVGLPEPRGQIREIAGEIVKMLSVLARNTRRRGPVDPGRTYA